MKAELRSMLNLESLETREVPAAGNVSLNVLSSEVRIIGDNNPNAIVFTQLSNGLIRVSGGASDGGVTTINNQKSVDIRADRLVSINLGNGNDKVTLQGTSTNKLRFGRDLSVQMGEGADRVTGNHVVVGGTTNVNMGTSSRTSGAESVAFTQIDLGHLIYRSESATGANSLSMNTSTVRGNMQCIGGSNSNSVSLASVTVNGLLSASLGNESGKSLMKDTFALLSVIAGGIQVDTGGGNSTVQLNRVTTNTLSVTGGNDSDQVLVSNSQVRRARFDGGFGNADAISGSGNTFSESLEVIRFERKALR